MPPSSTAPTPSAELGDLAREIDSPTAVIWTSVHVMKRCLEDLAAGAGGCPATGADALPPRADVAQLRQSVELAITAAERLVKTNRDLQKAILGHQESGAAAEPAAHPLAPAAA